MSYTLKIAVVPYESSEESEKRVEDRNVDLVRRGFPPIVINTGNHTESRGNTNFVRVQQEVVFSIDGMQLTDLQRIFLAHLMREKVVISYAVLDADGRRIEEHTAEELDR